MCCAISSSEKRRRLPASGNGDDADVDPDVESNSRALSVLPLLLRSGEARLPSDAVLASGESTLCLGDSARTTASTNALVTGEGGRLVAVGITMNAAMNATMRATMKALQARQMAATRH